MCTKIELDQILKEFSIALSKIFEDDLTDILLFGSYARGDYDNESDVDIALLVNIQKEEENKYNDQIIKVLGDLYEKYGYSVVLSPIVISKSFFDEWKNDLPFYKNVDFEGVSIVA